MKTEEKKLEKSATQLLREIRDKISLDIQDMTFNQLKKYIDDRLKIHPKSAWPKIK